MAIEHLVKKSAEELAEMRVKAAEARAARAAFNKANEHKYKLSYVDGPYWQELASKYRVRMPVSNVPASSKDITKYLKKCKVSADSFKESYGTIPHWLKHNPAWTLYGCVGTILELREMQGV